MSIRIMELIAIVYTETQIVIIVVVIVARTNCAITRSLFNLYVRSAKC